MSKTIQNLVINPASRLALETSNMFVHTRADSEMTKNDGIMIVLTASDIEMSDFNLNPFIAFSGGFPKSLVQNKLYPPLPSNLDGTAKFAPYGLRKVESLLIEEFGEENVVTVHPSNLHCFIGPKTKIVAISTMDPLGIGFVSRTYTGILGMNGKPATLVEFEKLLSNPFDWAGRALHYTNLQKSVRWWKTRKSNHNANTQGYGSSCHKKTLNIWNS